MRQQIALGLVEFRDDHSEPPFRKAHIRPIPSEVDIAESDAEDDDEDGDEQLATQVRGSYFYKQSQVAVKYLRKLLGAKAFNNPKDHIELSKLVGYTTADDPDCIVVDFFAGSGSTAEAVFEANASDGGKRRVVLVQVPEQLDPSIKQQKVAAKYCDDLGKPRTIAEITKERIRRAGTRVKNEQAKKADDSPIDVGFRALKIDTSNMAEVFYAPDAVKQDQLPGMVNNVKPDRTPEDLLFQVLLDWGVDLSLPIRQETIADKTVFFVNDNALLACFDTGVDEAFVKQLAAYKPLRVVFRDAGFANDAVKINVEQLFKLLSPATDIKTL
jgi:adenine-specific DNA-methyltransferase